MSNQWPTIQAQPINLILNSFEDLVKYAIAAKAELTQSQAINLALVIIYKKQIFKDNTQAWKRTNPALKTWDNFKYEFQSSQLDIRETGVTIDKLGLHTANIIIDQIMARL